MKKIISWLSQNILFLITLFLLAFIPLYPKIPLVDIVNTWVYIRAEDFVVFITFTVWIILLLRKKITLRTPLTIPIFFFWVIGAIATVHGVLLLFPEISNSYPNVALLSLLRRIEYLSLFFVGFAAIRSKKVLPYIIFVLVATVIGVILYGIGQKYFGFPAYLTMNEEFAKGVPIQLSNLGRVPSTFGGHYDLAAYLVLMIPFLTSLIFGFRNWFIKVFLIGTIAASFVLLFMTVSRVSFLVAVFALALVIFLQKKRWFLFSIPIVGVGFVVLLTMFAPQLMDRFGNTVKKVDVLVNAETGEALGGVQEIKPASYFREKNTLIWPKVFENNQSITAKPTNDVQDKFLASPSAQRAYHTLMDLSRTDLHLATRAGIAPYASLPPKSVLLVPPNISGEVLPQGTGYMNLTLSPIEKGYGEFFYERQVEDGTATISGVTMWTGYFLVKKASAYDLSFTTRFQGEWPQAIDAFKRNILLGSGYSSVGLAVDSSYIRMLGEVGLLGFIAFFVIFIAAWAYIKKTFRFVDSPLLKSFVIGFCAGVFGLFLNATLIDVFEASKIAFYLWLLMGITLGLLHQYYAKPVHFYRELQSIVTSKYAVSCYLIIATVIIFFPMLNNYFVGNDFSWLRPAAEGKMWDGSFYQPATTAFFSFMYSAFWLDPFSYHLASLIVHILIVLLVFLLIQKILQNIKLSILAAFLFVILSSYSEAIFWISSIGYVFSVFFILLSMFFFILWNEKKQIIYYLASFFSISMSLLFHEVGLVAPLMIMLYVFISKGSLMKVINQQRVIFGVLFLPEIVYTIIRFTISSRFVSDDTKVNVLLLPVTVMSNFIGYVILSLLGPTVIDKYNMITSLAIGNLLISFMMLSGFLFICWLIFVILKKVNIKERRIWLGSIGFMVVAVLPFLGLPGIASRYSYLVGFGFVLLFILGIKKMYKYLVVNGRDIAGALIALVVILFFFVQAIQMEKVHADWREAGIKVNRFFISLQNKYSATWKTSPIKFTFIDMPMRAGTAWMFPSGLEDAIWFNFKNPKIKVVQKNDIEKPQSLMKEIKDPTIQKVFYIDDFGRVITPEEKMNEIN